MRPLLLALLCIATFFTAGAVTTVPAFQFTCDSTARRVAPPAAQTQGYSAITVWNAACTAGVCATSATPVFLGGAYDSAGALVTAVTNATGMPICNDSTACIAVTASYETKNLQCIAASTTVVTAQVGR